MHPVEGRKPSCASSGEDCDPGGHEGLPHWTQSEMQAQCELLVAEHRRAKMVGKATAAQEKVTGVTVGSVARGSAITRMKARIGAEEAENYAAKQLGNGAVSGDTLVDRFEKLERDEKIERLLGELKQKQGRMLEAG